MVGGPIAWINFIRLFYRDNIQTLRDFVFLANYIHMVRLLLVDAGEKLAIVGPTGSGKSTLIRLLGRFYDFPDGRIFLDGTDINRLHSKDVRKRIGVVLQDFHIFSGTILDNIALDSSAISRDQAIESAKIVNAHGFISQLPYGYDTILLERGANLSQGQRQLLAFARVLAADPEVLVLDEATASIDTETDRRTEDTWVGQPKQLSQMRTRRRGTSSESDSASG